jgi:hypothetical protein
MELGLQTSAIRCQAIGRPIGRGRAPSDYERVGSVARGGVDDRLCGIAPCRFKPNIIYADTFGLALTSRSIRLWASLIEKEPTKSLYR